eukprot:jgi/Mesvir1/1619/Mv05060-RA.1
MWVGELGGDHWGPLGSDTRIPAWLEVLDFTGDPLGVFTVRRGAQPRAQEDEILHGWVFRAMRDFAGGLSLARLSSTPTMWLSWQGHDFTSRPVQLGGQLFLGADLKGSAATDHTVVGELQKLGRRGLNVVVNPDLYTRLQVAHFSARKDDGRYARDWTFEQPADGAPALVPQRSGWDSAVKVLLGEAGLTELEAMGQRVHVRLEVCEQEPSDTPTTPLPGLLHTTETFYRHELVAPADNRGASSAVRLGPGGLGGAPDEIGWGTVAAVKGCAGGSAGVMVGAGATNHATLPNCWISADRTIERSQHFPNPPRCRTIPMRYRQRDTWHGDDLICSAAAGLRQVEPFAHRLVEVFSEPGVKLPIDPSKPQHTAGRTAKYTKEKFNKIRTEVSLAAVNYERSEQNNPNRAEYVDNNGLLYFWLYMVKYVGSRSAPRRRGRGV